MTNDDKRSWWRKHFYDHPGLKTKDPQSFASLSANKAKVWCKLCFAARLAEEKQADAQLVANGSRATVRDESVVIQHMWALPGTSESIGNETNSWVSERSDVLLNHLRKCVLQPPGMRAQAQEQHDRRAMELAVRQAAKSSQRLAASTASHMQIDADTGGGVFPPERIYPAFPQNSFPSSSMPSQALSSPFPAAPIGQVGALHLQMDPVARMGMIAPHLFPASSSMPPSPSLSAEEFRRGPPPNLISSDSASCTSSRPPSRTGEKRPRLSSFPGPGPSGLSRTNSNVSHNSMPATWSRERQQTFEARLARITASAGFSLAWVENVEFLDFIEDFIPQAEVPSRKVLTSRIIPAELNRHQANAKVRVAGHNATVQCDGWSGENFHHFIAFMMTANREVFTVKVVDASAERKTAENLLAHMEDVISELESKWKVDVVAFTTDASGESKKARRLLNSKRPEIVTPDCYAHQVNLVVGDFFKARGDAFTAVSDHATELITWLRSKTFVLALLRKVQAEHGRNILSVIRAVLTRWTAHYLAYCRLLDLEPSLRKLVSDDTMKDESNSQLITGDARAKAKAREIVALINDRDNTFWNGIRQMKVHLEPLAYAANITQSAHCRLDDVVITFGFLYDKYNKLSGAENRTVKEAVIKSLESRWAKTDQAVFIAAVILHPLQMTKPFSRTHQAFTTASIHSLISQLWFRFYREAPPRMLFKQLMDYLNGTGEFESMMSWAQLVQNEAKEEKTSVDPLKIWSGIVRPRHEPTPLLKLAGRVLSICPNSASCERLFSIFGNTLTKLRNRLGTQALVALAELKMHLRDEHVKTGRVVDRLRRRFESAAASSAAGGGVSSDNAQLEVSESLRDNSNELQSQSIPCADDPRPSPHNITSHYIQLVDQDAQVPLDRFGLPVEDIPVPPNIALRGFSNIPLSELFSYEDRFWLDLHEKTAKVGLDTELELYDLVENTSGAETGIGPVLDEGTDIVLSM